VYSAPDPPGFPISLFRRIEETLLKAFSCLVFDAYGTLFHVHSVTIVAERIFPGQGSERSKGWRVRQLEYKWLRSLMNRYEDFWKVTESALVSAWNAMKLPLDASARGELMIAYPRLTPFPDAKQTLSALSGLPLAILSNGNAKMLEKALQNSSLEGALSHVVSVDGVKTYKPRPAAYQLAAKTMRSEPGTHV
jgi:2-haloacid dehalogenase